MKILVSLALLSLILVGCADVYRICRDKDGKIFSIDGAYSRRLRAFGKKGVFYCEYVYKDEINK